MGRVSLSGATWGTEGAFLVEKQQGQSRGREVGVSEEQGVFPPELVGQQAASQPACLLPLLIPGPLGRLPSQS